MPVYVTACPRNCYSTCSMKVHVENGRLRSIEPHPNNTATPEGICLKGLSYIERVYSPDRILHPLKRKRGTSDFIQIPWDEALGAIAEKLEYFRNEYGPQSILYYSSSGTKGLLNGVGMNFWRLFGGCTTTYGDLCWPAGLEATRLTFGDNINSDPQDIENARLIIFWGKNPAETNIHQMVFIEKAIENGAKLIVVDPRRTETAERAELLVQPCPGTDGALALAIARLLIDNGKTDSEFINNHVLGFDKFEEMTEDFTPEMAAGITGVPVEYILRLADYIGSIKPVTFNAGYGMQRYTNSGQAMRAIMSLLCITGNIGKPGAGWLFANLQSHIFDQVKDPLAFYPPPESGDPVRVSVSTALLGPHMLAADKPPIRMIWVERGNPVTQNPETETVLKAFRQLDFRVVIDQFLTDTAREADIILPAKTMFEQTDVINAYWHDYIQIKQKVIEPLGEVKPETEVYYLLAQRLGMTKEEINGKIPGPSDEEIEQYLEQKLEPFPELSLELLKQGPVHAPGCCGIAYEDLRFKTESGKIELFSREAESRWGLNPLPAYVEPVESTKNELQRTGKYPLYFMTPNTKNRIHSQFNNLRMIREVSPAPFVEINPADAEKRGIKHMDLVRIFNDRGSIRIEAHIDFGIKAGCVAVSNGWWITEGGTVNFISKARETDMGHGAAFHENLVEVEKV